MKKIWIVIVFACLAAVGYAAYVVTTSNIQVSVLEGMENQFFNGTDWVNMSDSHISNNIYPGSSNLICVRSRNIAPSGILGEVISLDSVSGLSYSVVCQQNGVSYTASENSILVKLESGADWQEICIKTSATEDITVSDLSYGISLSRQSAQASYDNVCSLD